MLEESYEAQLVIYEGKEVIKTYGITAGDALITIGLLPSNDISLPDKKGFVSRTHAAIVRLTPEEKTAQGPPRKISYMIRDLGSTHGTSVGNRYIHKKLLQHRDEIHICNYTLVFHQRRLASDSQLGRPLEKLYGHLPLRDQEDKDTALRPGRWSKANNFTAEQREFLTSFAKSGLPPDFPDHPQEFMNYLAPLVRYDKAVVGFYEEGKTHFTYIKGFERESPYCSEDFLKRLWKTGPIRQEAALWLPLPEEGVVALFRTTPPSFGESDLFFLQKVFGRLGLSKPAGEELRELTPWPLSLIGMTALREKCLEIAAAEGQDNSDVLIMGETGVGKEALARLIHQRSSRQDGPFITVSCPSLPKGLAHSELFGHEKGAFTDATEKKLGYLELADKGTLFLDEIGDMPLSLQAALLTALQQRVIRPLGSRKEKKIDIRVIAATDRNLEQMLEEETFRRALYERLGFKLSVPPLRERRTEIPLLAYYFLDQYSKNTRAISREALKCLREYAWPGNVRELQNVIKDAVLKKNDIIFSWDLPPAIKYARKVRDYQRKVQKTLKESEKEIIMKVLIETRGNRTEAAKILKISRASFYNKINEYGIPKYWGKIT
jgi:DNA-binding NtrC family response regulator